MGIVQKPLPTWKSEPASTGDPTEWEYEGDGFDIFRYDYERYRDGK